MTPTDAQQRVLDAIDRLTADGWPTTVREIGAEAGLASSSTVDAHLQNLRRLGLVEQHPTRPRAGWRLANASVRAA